MKKKIVIFIAVVLLSATCSQITFWEPDSQAVHNHDNAGEQALPTPTPTPTPPPKEIAVLPTDETLDIVIGEKGIEQRDLVVRVNKAYNHPLFTDFVSLSPDEHQVLYVTSEITRPLNTSIWTAQADGSSTTRIAQFEDTFWAIAPIWSPDSTHIAYVTKKPASAPDEGLQLWRMRRDGSNPTLITEGGDFRPALFEHVPQGVIEWSADSAYIEFKNRWSFPPELFRVNVETGKISQSLFNKEPDVLQELLDQRAAVKLPCPVPVYNQKNYSEMMNPCAETITRSGCALCAATIVLGYYGVPVNPSGLNGCLGAQACPLKWWDVAEYCSHDKVTGLGFLEDFSYDVLDEELAAGRPIIVLVTSASYGTHFIVVTGGSGQKPETYTINDPVDGSSNRTLARYSTSGWELERIYRYNGQPACPDGYGQDPDGGDMHYAQTIPGLIEPARDTDDFFFMAAAGDSIEVRVNGNGSPLDPVVALYGPDTMLIAYDDDSGGASYALLQTTLPAEGRYRMRVHGYGDSTGSYMLRLDRK